MVILLFMSAISMQSLHRIRSNRLSSEKRTKTLAQTWLTDLYRNADKASLGFSGL